MNKDFLINKKRIKEWTCIDPMTWAFFHVLNFYCFYNIVIVLNTIFCDNNINLIGLGLGNKWEDCKIDMVLEYGWPDVVYYYYVVYKFILHLLFGTDSG
jgi:hypothetical protein